MATWYVNTDNTGTKDGTTFATGYDNLQDAVAAKAGVLSEPCIFECGGSADDTTAVSVTGYTTSEANYIEIKAYTGYGHSGVWDDSKYVLAVADDIVLSVAQSYTRISGIQVRLSSATALRRAVYLNAASCRAGNLLVRGAATASAFYGIQVSNSAAGSVIYNTIIYDTGSSGSSAGIICDASATLYNCTVVAGTNHPAYYRTAGTLAAYNCYGKGETNYTYYGTITKTNCASTDTTTGTSDGCLSSVAYDTVSGTGHAGFVSTTPATDGTGDFLKLKSDSALVGAGTDNPGSGLYSTDISGGTRTSTWDIGAFEYIAAVTSQFARPASDVADGNWLNESSSNVNLYASIDETSASDSDYIRSGSTPVDDTCTVGLSSISTPAAGTVTMRIRARFL